MERPLLFVSRGQTPTTALLSAWAEWRRSPVGAATVLGYTSWLGRLVYRRARETGDERIPASAMPRPDPALMAHTDSAVRSLPNMGKQRVRAVIIEHFTGPPHWTIARHAKRAKVSPRQYYRLLQVGTERVSAAVDWSMIDVIPLERKAAC